jgi:fluoride ion exporter CrcB/FEX
MSDIQSQAVGQNEPVVADQLPNGPAAAAILSAAIGCCALGLLAVIGDGSAAAAHWLTFYLPTGPLSGVTTMAIFVWLLAWLILARRWRSKTVAIAKVNAVAFVLLGVSLLLTFPPFADLLLGK